MVLKREGSREVMRSRIDRQERSGAFLAEFLAEREGFEPPVPFWGTAVFETAAFDRSAISPRVCMLQGSRAPGKRRAPSGTAQLPSASLVQGPIEPTSRARTSRASLDRSS